MCHLEWIQAPPPPLRLPCGAVPTLREQLPRASVHPVLHGTFGCLIQSSLSTVRPFADFHFSSLLGIFGYSSFQTIRKSDHLFGLLFCLHSCPPGHRTSLTTGEDGSMTADSAFVFPQRLQLLPVPRLHQISPSENDGRSVYSHSYS